MDKTKGFLEAWRAGHTGQKEKLLERMHRALRHLAKDQPLYFHVDREIDTYIKPASTATARGFKVVLFGHTHLLKRVRLADGGLYINTGTWADLMRLPDAVLGEDEAAARRELTAFVDDLAAGRLEAWREQFPSFARIELSSGGDLVSADLFLFHAPDRIEYVPAGSLARNVP
jgi:hypothetical protein